MVEIRKAEPAPDYPPEEGCYLRGNDYSPVAVLVILKWIREESPPEIEALVRVGLESGAALSGTLQTENVGLEKVICNVVANPNIRYLIVCGPESPGHRVGETILALMEHGIDDRKRIVGATAQTPYLFNLPVASIERFRGQVTVIDLIDEGRPEVIREAVQACYQEAPTPFHGYRLHDVGAYPERPISGRITWRVTDPSREPKSDEERAGYERLRALMDRVRRATEARAGPRTRQPGEQQDAGRPGV
jgi:tetrahydromethanopterin S-methyltransferase subunit A